MTQVPAHLVQIVPFDETYAGAVRDLFVTVNRALAPPDRRAAFEDYIARSIAAEIGRIADYYRERHGSFRLAIEGDRLRGMYGLEATGPGRMELRRMYVAPDFQRRGLARRMLADAEAVCRATGSTVLELSTSELQQPALALYRGAGFDLLREEIAETGSNKTIGGGIRRFHFEKRLG
ncbi:GNAT family N-acetyltransferase [Aurantimonas sp. VKM B-3413]|uniref:GNAT family N-acetyltransferase n=1 Tax=Aurantimonas sp. VKM B-3413 TaxID=2779401 RepID=UPI001E642B4A|nr:GNAT family N-acetyltransferase [Aurantimonas sp. VKM B-3413]MCB8838232.1 GNAT family N-acetyltransferase [Aurantimonas sp. VKM B-3413]